jgi:CheY-like chemotaxis protein
MAITARVVDDSVTMLLSLKTTLSMTGHQVETAAHRQAAFDKLNLRLSKKVSPGV